MTIAEFAEITRRVIARDGFDGYLPTAAYPDRREFVVLEGVPEGSDIETIALNWASERAEDGAEFLVAFQCGPTRFKIVRQHLGVQESGEFEATRSDA